MLNTQSKSISFEELSDSSRIWIYQSNRFFSDEEVLLIKQKGDAFASNWATHGIEMPAAVEVFHNLFVVICADQSHVSASGCSIDASVAYIRELQSELNVDLLDRMQVAYIEGDKVERATLQDFKESYNKGDVTVSTLVFNNLLSEKGELNSSWIIPLEKSWHTQMPGF